MWELIKVSQHPAKFGGHRHCGSGDKLLLVCLVISEDHVIKELCDYIGRSLSRLLTILSSPVAIGTVIVEYRFNGFNLLHDLARPREQSVE